MAVTGWRRGLVLPGNAGLSVWRKITDRTCSESVAPRSLGPVHTVSKASGRGKLILSPAYGQMVYLPRVLDHGEKQGQGE